MHQELRRIRRRRRWADVVVIFNGIYVTMMAVYAPQLADPAPRVPALDPGLWWLLYAVAGPLALVALLVAFRSRVLARIMVAVAGAILLAGVLLFPAVTTTVVVTLIAPGLLFLLVSPFVGPMPTRAEEAPPG